MRERLTWIENEICDQALQDMKRIMQWELSMLPKARRLPRKRKKAFKKAMNVKMHFSYEFYQSDPI